MEGDKKQGPEDPHFFDTLAKQVVPISKLNIRLFFAKIQRSFRRLGRKVLAMQKKLNRKKILNQFRPIIRGYVRRAKEHRMNPVDLVLQIGGPEVDTSFVYNWKDAEQEIAFSWLRQMERRAH